MSNAMIIKKYCLVVLVLASSVFYMACSLADNEIDHDEAMRLRTEGEILPLESILEKAKAIHSGKVLEAELEKKHDGYIYELEIIADDGSVWELKYDAKTATLLSQEEEDGH